MFDQLRRVGIQLFADEIGHVGYCAATCTSAERAIMPRLHPHLGRLFARQTPEISQLADREQLHALLNRPFDVEAPSADLPHRTLLAAHP